MKELQERLRQGTRYLQDHKHQIIGIFCVAVFTLAVAPVRAGFGDTIVILAAQFLAWISQTIVLFVVQIINVFVVPILRYSHFVDSKIVEDGWTIVRDLVNMFFIVVLLVIAFQTIFGIGRADWRKQVPRLLIMAVVINFSRTICGLIIDFGQVIMITFVNAIKDIAGGNFINMFNLGALYTFSTDAANVQAENGGGFGPFELLGTSFLALVISFVVLGTVLTMVFLFAFRIVVLWILIIMSPLAFFLGGAKGVIGPAEGYYSDWWKRFTGAVSLGPILTFFLWLSLAAAGGGGLSESQDFDVNVNSPEYKSDTVAGSITTKAFDAPHLTSLIISLALLFAGIEISQQTASSIGGSAGKIASSGVAGIPGLSRQLARVWIGLPAGAAFAGGKAAAGAGFRASGLQKLAWEKRGKWGEAIAAAGAGMADSGIPGLSMAGRAVRGFGYKQIAATEERAEEMRTEANKSLAGLGFDQLKQLANTEIITDRKVGNTPEAERVKIEAARIKMLTDKKKIAKLSKDEINNYAESYYKSARSLPDDIKDKVGKTGMMIAPQMAAQADKDLKQNKMADFKGEELERKKQELVNSQMGQVAKNSGNLRDLDASVYNDTYAWEAMQKTKVGTTGKTVAEWISEGNAGEDAKKLYDAAEKKMTGDRVTAFKQTVAGNQSDVNDVETKKREIENKRVQDLAGTTNPTTIAAINRTAQLDTKAQDDRLKPALDKLTAAILGLSASDLKAGAVTTQMLADSRFFDAFTGAADKNENIPKLATLNTDLFTAINDELETRKQNALRSLGNQYVAQHTGPAAAPTYRERSTGRIFPTRQAMETDSAYQAAKTARDTTLRNTTTTALNMGGGVGAIGYNRATGDFDSDVAREIFQSMVADKPEIVVKIGDLAGATGAIGKAVGEAINPQKITQLLGNIRSAKSGSYEQNQLISTMDRLYLAMKNNAASAASQAEWTKKLVAVENAKKRIGR